MSPDLELIDDEGDAASAEAPFDPPSLNFAPNSWGAFRLSHLPSLGRPARGGWRDETARALPEVELMYAPAPSRLGAIGLPTQMLSPVPSRPHATRTKPGKAQLGPSAALPRR